MPVHYKLHLSYDGTAYSGFQIQINAITIQECLEKALRTLYGKDVRIIVAGRTDSGVHAREQVVHLQAEPRIPVERIPLALNSLLPSDIRIWHAEKVEPDFHARRLALQKTYLYTIDGGRYPDVFQRLYAWHFPKKLDLARMNRGAEYLLGEHDFLSFSAAGSTVTSTVRTLYRLQWKKFGHFLVMTVTGSGFLYKMIRIIVGTLVNLGVDPQGEPRRVREILLARDRNLAASTAPPHGLCLWSIKYSGDPLT